MISVSRRLLVTVAAAGLAIALPCGVMTFGQAQTPAGPTFQMSDKYFKNVKVLTGIPVDEFMGTMGLFSAALSYCCGDCHTGAGTDNPKWEDDPPRKIMARRMAAMVKAINKDNFGGGNSVTCWTCHRGSPSPSVTPSIDTIYGEPLAFPSDFVVTAKSGAPTADQVFDKYIQALGGAGPTGRITSYTAKGTSHLFGETTEDPVEIFAKAPDQLATFVHQREGDVARTFDGRDAWVMLPLTVVQEYPLSASARGRQAGCRTGLSLADQAIIPELDCWRSNDSRQSRCVRRAGQSYRNSGHVLFRQADGSDDAHDPVCQLSGRASSDANRLLRLPSGQRRHDAVQVDLRLGQRQRRVRDRGLSGECSS